MNKHGILVLVLLSLISSVFYAQGNSTGKFTISGVIVFPVGEYVRTEGDKAGYATSGFGLLLDHSKLLYDTFGLYSTLGVNIQSMNEAAMELQMPGVFVSTENYVQMWAMTGPGMEIKNTPETTMYWMLQIGGLLSSYPNIFMESGGITTKEETDMVTGLAYGLGIGVKYKELHVGMRFYGCSADYEHIISTGRVKETIRKRLPVSVLNLAVGINL